jgi:hypothetical protein
MGDQGLMMWIAATAGLRNIYNYYGINTTARKQRSPEDFVLLFYSPT